MHTSEKWAGDTENQHELSQIAKEREKEFFFQLEDNTYSEPKNKLFLKNHICVSEKKTAIWKAVRHK